MERKEQKSEPVDVTVDWAYEVLGALAEAMDKVGTKPEMSKAFIFSIQQKYPEILDAVMAVTVPEHREIVSKVVKACSRVTATWLKMGKMP